MSDRGRDPFRQLAADALRQALAAAARESYPLSLRGRALAWLASSEATWWWQTVELSQSQALLRWGWVNHAQEVLEEDDRRARDPVTRDPKSVQTPEGRFGRFRLTPADAALLREGIEYLTELQRRGPGARIRLSQSGPAQTVQHIAQMPENPRHLHVETDRRSLYLPKRRRVWLADRRVA